MTEATVAQTPTTSEEAKSRRFNVWIAPKLDGTYLLGKNKKALRTAMEACNKEEMKGKILQIQVRFTDWSHLFRSLVGKSVEDVIAFSHIVSEYDV